MDCSTPIHTPIQHMEWSAVWSASLLTPKNNAGLECGLALNFFVDWSVGLHSKKSECSNALEAIIRDHMWISNMHMDM